MKRLIGGLLVVAMLFGGMAAPALEQGSTLTEAQQQRLAVVLDRLQGARPAPLVRPIAALRRLRQRPSGALLEILPSPAKLPRDLRRRQGSLPLRLEQNPVSRRLFERTARQPPPAMFRMVPLPAWRGGRSNDGSSAERGRWRATEGAANSRSHSIG